MKHLYQTATNQLLLSHLIIKVLSFLQADTLIWYIYMNFWRWTIQWNHFEKLARVNGNFFKHILYFLNLIYELFYSLFDFWVLLLYVFIVTFIIFFSHIINDLAFNSNGETLLVANGNCQLKLLDRQGKQWAETVRGTS